MKIPRTEYKQKAQPTKGVEKTDQMSLTAIYRNCISENYKVDIYKDNIRNVQIKGHGPRINGMYSNVHG